MSERFQELFSTPNLALCAAALHPQYHALSFLQFDRTSAVEIENIKKGVRQKIAYDSWFLQTPSATVARVVSLKTVEAQFGGVWDQLSAPEPDQPADVLSYWSARASQHSAVVISYCVCAQCVHARMCMCIFTHCGFCADGIKMFLAVPATSASSERIKLQKG